MHQGHFRTHVPDFYDCLLGDNRLGHMQADPLQSLLHLWSLDGDCPTSIWLFSASLSERYRRNRWQGSFDGYLDVSFCVSGRALLPGLPNIWLFLTDRKLRTLARWGWSTQGKRPGARTEARTRKQTFWIERDRSQEKQNPQPAHFELIVSLNHLVHSPWVSWFRKFKSVF